MILVTIDQGNGEGTEAYYAMLPTAARSFSAEAIGSINDNLTPLNEKEGYSSVDLHLPSPTSTMARSGHTGAEDSVVLHFMQSMEEAPEVMHLMYAIGSSREMGYHLSRECFDIAEFPTCPIADSTTGSSSIAKENAEEQAFSNTDASSGCSSSWGVFVAGIIVLAAILL